MIVCAGKSESFDFATPIGVGLVESAINLTEILCKKMPNRIIFIGSAGLYKEGNLFEIFESQNAANIEISLLDAKSYVPVPQEIFNDVSHETFINSSNFITKDEASAHKLFNLGAYAENMEFFSVLSVAKKFQIPARGIFIATNFCNENAHKDFITNHTLAKDILCEYLEHKGII
ncbi:purine nucleoside phosphorylase [Campylobacter mucosalis]|uniref:purine-nucleoside phosphorylase n=1 Tax=Campylobacter mucosalis TaxID=202 RepID=UPI0004D93376|nr:purine-nucleoside phosphorylase [Campylobacter mucosalis]KEA45354.1 purine nucleoside phosphorylase [Campylobacter mucosalis]QKF62204.1 putative nucleoside phosphorylase [Campylobacter mucosalis]